MKRKRKTYSGAFKANMALGAIIGLKTVAQLAREYQVHPMLVSHCKGTIGNVPSLSENAVGGWVAERTSSADRRKRMRVLANTSRKSSETEGLSMERLLPVRDMITGLQAEIEAVSAEVGITRMQRYLEQEIRERSGGYPDS